MDDLTATRLCAEAMGITHSWTETNVYFGTGAWNLETSVIYHPIYDDAQAMALVKRFKLSLAGPSEEIPQWFAYDVNDDSTQVSYIDLNLTIVYCVAAMQAKK